MTTPSENHAESPTPPENITVTAEQLEHLIANLRPKGEVYTGITFLQKLLKSRGVDGVIAFVNKASHALNKEGSLDLAFDFDEVEKEIFNESRPNMSRRNFLHTVGYVIPGAVFGAYGATSLAERVTSQRPSKPASSASTRRSFLSIVKDSLDAIPMDIANITIGAALINEGAEKYAEIKIEQIADAVSVLDERLRLQKPSANVQGR